MHATRQKLLATTLQLMETRRPEELTAELVLQRSEISKGSLYHHFEDFSDLLETALTELFSQSVDANSAMMRQIVETTGSAGECFKLLSEVTRATQSTEMYMLRAKRAGVLAMSASNARLAKKIAEAQDRLTQNYTQLFAVLQERGWMNTDFDPHAASILIQAYTVGKIVDDVANYRVPPEKWSSLIDSIVVKVFGLHPN